MTNTQQAILTGFSLGMFTLAVMFYIRVDARIMAQNSYQTQALEDFKEFAEKTCKHGYSVAEFLKTGEYKVECN